MSSSISDDNLSIVRSSPSLLTLSNGEKVELPSWILSNNSTLKLAIKSPKELELKDLTVLDKIDFEKDILLIGCGNSFIIPEIQIKNYIHHLGFKLEWMTTPSALNVWNFLKDDSRSVTALFFPKIDFN